MDRLTTFLMDKNMCNASSEIGEQQKGSPYDENCCCYCDIYQKMIDKLAKYEDAEEQGRLLQLPCKPGDYVYQLDRLNKKILTKKVRCVNCYISQKHFSIQIELETAGIFFDREFGKSVFLKKDEARQALKEEKQ